MNKNTLQKLYIKQKFSSKEIGEKLSVSTSKVNYWLAKYDISKRTLSESQYIKQNPDGDPFTKQKTFNKRESFLFGLGLGLYWGEGTKASKNSVRLGNTDSALLLCFLEFLEIIYKIDRSKVRFSIQIFNDLNAGVVEAFWRKKLKVKKDQFYKTIVSPSQSTGTYRKKAKYGVVTMYFNNTKLRNILVEEIEKLKNMY